MSDFQTLIGVPGYASGTNGTATVPSGAFIHLILVHASAASASFTIFGGAAIPIIQNAAPMLFPLSHSLFQSNASNGGSVTFTNTDHYFVHWIRQGNV